MRRTVALFLILTSTVAAAQNDPERAGGEEEGLFVGEAYRYDQLSLPLRMASDLVAIPASIPRWKASDWAAFGLVAAPTLALMLPLENPYDARVQKWVRTAVGPDKLVWTTLGDVIIWGSIATGIASELAYGYFAGDARFVEQTSLVLEAFAVTQAFHLTFKFLLGREGPNDADALGVIHGPAGFFRLFPSGTPSGHVASLYAIIGVIDRYWEKPWLTALLHVAGFAFASSVVADNYHFVSDVIWGAGMGYAVGRWVVLERRAPMESEPSKNLTPQVGVVPLPTGGGALTLTGRF